MLKKICLTKTCHSLYFKEKLMCKVLIVTKMDETFMMENSTNAITLVCINLASTKVNKFVY